MMVCGETLVDVNKGAAHLKLLLNSEVLGQEVKNTVAKNEILKALCIPAFAF